MRPICRPSPTWPTTRKNNGILTTARYNPAIGVSMWPYYVGHMMAQPIRRRRPIGG
ncbi:protein of unknown function [Candidatus Promineifilum breve]|uniref:Uncharacterized protein n=1 Tax=Candidatus Promineifilum breve TaxID=1806508 RepID=A0A160T4F0_9CHLR|nr:protein of unknown function [Candidatus Promineifilum breve]